MQRSELQVREITDRLEEGIRELFDSEKYQEYLRVMSKFYNYSFNNTLLIALQRPDATIIAGYNSWRKDFGRYVKKGEKAIKIFAPTSYKTYEKRKIRDPDTHAPILDANGEPVVEVRAAPSRPLLPPPEKSGRAGERESRGVAEPFCPPAAPPRGEGGRSLR